MIILFYLQFITIYRIYLLQFRIFLSSSYIINLNVIIIIESVFLFNTFLQHFEPLFYNLAVKFVEKNIS